jgi:hypothetical protein
MIDVYFRFVGPHSEVKVWSPYDKREKVTDRRVRTESDVMHVTGSRFKTYVLLPEQLEVYKDANEEKYVFLSG